MMIQFKSPVRVAQYILGGCVHIERLPKNNKNKFPIEFVLINNKSAFKAFDNEREREDFIRDLF